MANLLVVAVDTGNKNIKTPHTEPFNSGLICHGNIPPAIKADTLCYEGNYYTLTQSRVPYMYDKTSDWSYYVLCHRQGVSGKRHDSSRSEECPSGYLPCNGLASDTYP